VDMRARFAGLVLKNPVIAASGTYGFGREYSEYANLGDLGGISVKGLTLRPRRGNPPPRIAETPYGVLNSVGLQNPGVEAFIKDELPFLRGINGLCVIANFAGSSLDEYREGVRILSESTVDAIELNVSCPNVKQGGMHFGATRESLFEVVDFVKPACKKPLIVKLTPNAPDIGLLAKTAESAGADAVSLINTLLGMRIDIRTRRPVLRNNVGGLSGPAIFPVALRMTWEAARSVNIPVIGMGGISTGEEAIEFMLAGAAAVMVGTVNFIRPDACARVAAGIREYCERRGISAVSELVGGVEPWNT